MRLQDFIFPSNYQQKLPYNIYLKKVAGLFSGDYLCGILFAV